MTILSVVRSVCLKVGVIVPSSVFAGIGSNRTMQEMVDCANEMAQRIASDTRAWTRLKTSVTYEGDGLTTAFNLPANYKRMLLTSNVWRSTSTQQPMLFISDTDEWMQRRAAEYADAWGEWTLLGDYMHIFPVMASGTSARFSYVDKNCVTLAAGGYGEEFVQDTDSFRLDERLLKLGMLWQWKQQKGAPYAEEMGTWSDTMAMVLGADKPSPILIGNAPASAFARGGAFPSILGPQS